MDIAPLGDSLQFMVLLFCSARYSGGTSMFINRNRIRAERDQYCHRYPRWSQGDCGVQALAFVAHTTYLDAMRLLRGHKNIGPVLVKNGCNGFSFKKLKIKAKNAETFAKLHPEGRFVLYCGRFKDEFGWHNHHHYVPCVHGEIVSASDYMRVTTVYQAC